MQPICTGNEKLTKHMCSFVTIVHFCFVLINHPIVRIYDHNNLEFDPNLFFKKNK